MEYLLAALMGVVEGLTEFLPVSSTGHLILTSYYSGFRNLVGEELAEAFEIIIQLGAILAIVAAFPSRFIGLLHLRYKRGFSGIRGIGLLAITTIPISFVALLTHKLIKEKLFNPLSVAMALGVGALWILLTEYYKPRAKIDSIDSITWREALFIGFFQCLSLWPGMSRAASTILGGMISGLDRKTATQYSFFAAVPTMIAATFFELYKDHQYLNEHFQLLAIGFIVSFVVAWLTVKGFLWFLGRYTLIPFGWYRLVFSAVVFWSIWRFGLS